MDKKTWIEHKVAKLIEEGKTEAEAIALANSMYEDEYGDKKEVAAPEFVEDAPLEIDSISSEALKTAHAPLWKDLAEITARGIEHMTASLKSAFGKKADEGTGFKVITDLNGVSHFLATWTNNFIDRESEIFPESEIDAYVARVDKGLVPQPELWVWHGGKEVRIGAVEQIAGHGHFGLAAGVFDDSELGHRARDFYANPKHAKETRISHGFTYPVSQFDGKHYRNFNTFEISLLPRGAEANLYTSLEGVKDMQIDEKKLPYFHQVFGKEAFERTLAALDEKGKAQEELGAEYKDFTHVDTETAKTEAVDAAEKEFGALVADLAEGSTSALQAALVAVKEAKAVRAELATALAEIAEMRKELALRPRASQAAATEITEAKAKDLFPDVVTQVESVDPFWNTKVQTSLNGNS